MLARHYGGRVVPWVFRYDGMDEALGARYKPWRLLLSRSRHRWGRFTAAVDVPVIWCCRTIIRIVMDSPARAEYYAGARR